MNIQPQAQGPGNWSGQDLAASQRWRFHLSAADLAQIDTAVARLRSRVAWWNQVERTRLKAQH